MSRELEALDEALVGAMSEAARRVATADQGAGPRPAAWHRLQHTLSRSPRARWRWALAGTVTVAALVFAGVTARRAVPLTYTVQGGQVESNGYLRGAGQAGTSLRFSDGTRVHLTAGTRMSIGAPGARGARLRLEEGEAHFEVAHRARADWSVEAGPYRVQVTGTVFDVRWSGAREAAEIHLRAGAVRVTGPELTEPVTLKAGQRLLARLASHQLSIEDDQGGARTERGEAAAPPPPPEPPAVPEQPVSPARPAVVNGPTAPRPPRPRGQDVDLLTPFQPASWPRRLAAGEAAGVVAEARARPLDDVLDHVDGAALAALADAARYAGDTRLAERALLQQRRRFADTTAAQGAAFLLGRIADDRGDTDAALGWYRRYRAEAAQGPYAAEALGREMLAVERQEGRAAAAVLAREYLSRFPNGTYPLQARAILQLP